MWTCLLLERGRLCIGLGQWWGSRRPRFRAGSEYSLERIRKSDCFKRVWKERVLKCGERLENLGS